MKKTGLMALLGILALACTFSDVTSLIPLNSTPAPPQTQTSTLVPSDTPTITPTLPTPTFTGTPTLIYSGPTPLPPTPLFSTGTPYASGMDNSNPPPGSVGFTSIQLSGNVIRWGSCEPSSVKFTAYVTDPIKEKTVLLFLRLKDTKSDNMTDWGYGAEMDGNGRGVFTYTVAAKTVPNHTDFLIAWVQYQLVAFDRQMQEVGRTQPVLSNLSIGPCQ